MTIPRFIPVQQQAIIQQMVDKRKFEMHMAQLTPKAAAE
jgi:hypothetical protein